MCIHMVCRPSQPGVAEPWPAFLTAPQPEAVFEGAGTGAVRDGSTVSGSGSELSHQGQQIPASRKSRQCGRLTVWFNPVELG